MTFHCDTFLWLKILDPKKQRMWNLMAHVKSIEYEQHFMGQINTWWWQMYGLMTYLQSTQYQIDNGSFMWWFVLWQENTQTSIGNWAKTGLRSRVFYIIIFRPLKAGSNILNFLIKIFRCRHLFLWQMLHQGYFGCRQIETRFLQLSKQV